MDFSPRLIKGFSFEQVKTDKDKLALRNFFKQHYSNVAQDVFPEDDFKEYYNPLIVKVTDASGKIVAGLLSCTPPMLAEQTFKNPTKGNLNKVKRLTFLDLIAVDKKSEEAYPILLDLYVEISKSNGVKSIIGFTKDLSYLSSQLEAADFAVLNPREKPPLLQGINWELPPTEPKDSTVWFYKIL